MPLKFLSVSLFLALHPVPVFASEGLALIGAQACFPVFTAEKITNLCSYTFPELAVMSRAVLQRWLDKNSGLAQKSQAQCDAWMSAEFSPHDVARGKERLKSYLEGSFDAWRRRPEFHESCMNLDMVLEELERDIGSVVESWRKHKDSQRGKPF
jgi:hypothetical protein